MVHMHTASSTCTPPRPQSPRCIERMAKKENLLQTILCVRIHFCDLNFVVSFQLGCLQVVRVFCLCANANKKKNVAAKRKPVFSTPQARSDAGVGRPTKENKQEQKTQMEGENRTENKTTKGQNQTNKSTKKEAFACSALVASSAKRSAVSCSICKKKQQLSQRVEDRMKTPGMPRQTGAGQTTCLT